MYAEQFVRAITLNQAVLYSSHQMTENDRKYMLEFIASTVEKVVKPKSFFQRVKLKYWDSIY